MNEEIDIILSRYFSGEANKKELNSLDIWLSKSDENDNYFHQMTQLYQYTGQKEVLPVIDPQKALAQFKTHISNTSHLTPHTSHLSPHTLWRVAAAIALFFIATFALYYFIQPAKTMHVVAVETQKEFTISENVNVTLFQGSEIVYNKKNENHIQLKGKATFTVQSEKTKGLIVQAGETNIEDIGTIFTVDAVSPQQSITITVSEGEVWFYTDQNSGVYVAANESAVYNVPLKKFNIIAKKTTFIDPLQNDELIFQNITLREAIEILKTRYHVDIVINSKSMDEIFLNASFDTTEPVDYILEIITATLSAQCTRENSKYVITL
jgi:ferric-dicitrate binding protein FerR (iron transport regulator)